jgi:Zn-dependent peptidase ImmA (M78 family)
MRVLAAFAAVVCLAVLGSDWSVADKGETAKLAGEIAKLSADKPLKFAVEVAVIDRRVAGWYDPAKRKIYIVDHGVDENKRTLRHEWQHAVQHSGGVEFSDSEAERAE